MVISKSIALPPGRGYAAAAIADSLAEQYLSLGSLTLRALTHAAQGQDPQALEDFQRAIAAEEPTDTAGSAQTRVFLGRFYAQRGDYKTAQGLYREALEIVPDYPLVHLQMAELATIKGQYRTAKYHYQAVGGPIALHGLARLQALQGRPANEAWDSAEQELRRTIAGNAFGHRRDLAHLLLERGDPADREEAVALMEAESAGMGADGGGPLAGGPAGGAGSARPRGTQCRPSLSGRRHCSGAAGSRTGRTVLSPGDGV